MVSSRTYNSLEAPWGKVSQRWWQAYERYLQVNDGEVDVFDATGNPLRFMASADGTYTTPKGYSKDLKKNADGTFTLTDRKSGTKDTYNQYGTLRKVTNKNDGTITVEQHDEGSEHKGFKLTETRSGRWIGLVKTDPNQWQAKDDAGRTAVLDLDGSGNLAKVTDTALAGAAAIRARVATVVDVSLAAVDVAATVFVMNDGGRFHRCTCSPRSAAISPWSSAAAAATRPGRPAGGRRHLLPLPGH